MGEFEEARAAAADRREAKRIESRARMALATAGWSSTEAELLATVTAQADKKIDKAAVYQAALRIQREEKSRERRYTPEEMASMPRTFIPAETRAKIREHVRQRRAEQPAITPEPLRQEVNRVFGQEISAANFYITYWSGVSGAAKKPERPRATKRKPRTLATAAPAAARAAATPTNGRRAPVVTITLVAHSADRLEVRGDVAAFLRRVGIPA